MPPVVTDLQVADKDWQVSMLPADSWLGRNMNRKWVKVMRHALNFLVLLSSLWNTSTNLMAVVCFFRISSPALPWPLSG